MKTRKKRKANNLLSRNFIFFCAISVIAIGYFLVETNNTANYLADISQTSVLAVAQEGHPKIQFPVSELGNCQNKNECKAHCDMPKNMLACVNFAERHGLMSKSEAEKGRRMSELGNKGGPGGCNSHSSCEVYCSNIDNIRECIAFAKENNMISASEIKEAEQVIRALDKGATLPGGCTSKSSCDAYCKEPANIRQCIDFAEAAGFVNSKEATMIRKTGGYGPGRCFGQEACEAYCSSGDHMVECIEFATKHDLMPAGEREEALKVLTALKNGAKLPGGCSGKSACEEYCRNPDNMKECLDFAEAAGFMSKKEASMARKMMEKGIMSGPGGCQSEESCINYCSNPAHMLECMAFSAKHGIDMDDLREK